MILSRTTPALMCLLSQLLSGLFTALSGTQWPQLTSNKSPAMNRDKNAAVHVQPGSGSGVEYYESKHRKERNSMCTWKIFILIMFSVRHPLSSHHSRHLISITLITMLFSRFTHVSVVFCHPRGSFPVGPVSSRLNKVLCANWQTGSVLSLPLTGRMNLNTGGLGTCEHISDGVHRHT